MLAPALPSAHQQRGCLHSHDVVRSQRTFQHQHVRPKSGSQLNEGIHVEVVYAHPHLSTPCNSSASSSPPYIIQSDSRDQARRTNSRPRCVITPVPYLSQCVTPTAKLGESDDSRHLHIARLRAIDCRQKYALESYIHRILDKRRAAAFSDQPATTSICIRYK